MADFEVDVDPAEAGFDAARLSRIDAHFDRYVEDGRLPGWLAVVSRHGRIVHIGRGGQRDVEASLPVETDTLWRIFSMTKPITSVAAMMLAEEGLLELDSPISQWLPEFASPRVYVKGSALAPSTESATSPIRVWHLLTHTAGLTYGFHHGHPVDAIYRAAGFEWGTPPGLDLAACSSKWAALPLLFQPGTEWNYSVATDVLGRLVEVVSGLPLDEFFASRIFSPLGMTDTGFVASSPSRLAAMYVRDPSSGRATRNDAFGRLGTARPDCLSGGGGLVSSAADYWRFTQMLLRGGELDGVRVLSPRTVALMASNHLPGRVDLEAFGRPLFAEMPFDGHGFGLGFSVLEDPVKARTLSSPGEFAWGGAASTAFWVDPDEDLTVGFYTQLLPSSSYRLRPQLRQLVYQAMVD
ncbi:beta-lactamase class C [Amycolatopsis mediterranei S699]|uniref:Beta-lactamase class C n=2 Tax=Amycolatopsis mediterranei TaxID=33910 RepID=A0A0H3DFF9_AMYMU|nr:serine hydrolase domain-containing protein [Amycolatopsis mediterranei]ADJ48374.1 beta-lactamase class C [Amycolatopsis mediterranei U32]AEK45295.1 beta-lactamase class C [Amycolatopsis mediterranei S699]AFO80084.1 beta-lactamase class C [Amycolatopsis mediterranei S699]AGT87212.1 beta-lactamase class C [Amycolatopsis mediterranei RB]KDO10893.1 beta-lactamase [Amycolatopsis mediterranei]